MEASLQPLENPQMNLKITTMNKNIFYSLITLITLSLVVSCSPKQEGKIILVKNNLAMDRSFETIELTKTLLKFEDLTSKGIRDVATGEILITQLIDSDENGTMDVLLFQPKIAASSEMKYELIDISADMNPKAEAVCYSRFVPERIDDYAWENDKVAFRVFGPTAQKMIEEGDKSGTLTSGIDAWLKKVDYPIIDKWYKKTLEGNGSYHEDTGEGLDNFHVGASRGLGGIAIKKNDEYYYSKNYLNWHTITTGPLRTSFYIDFESWDVDGSLVQESRFVSLDFGSNFSKFEIYIYGSDHISAGLTLHEKDGEVKTGSSNWASYWQPHGDSELGSAIITSPAYFLDVDNYQTDEKDLSNLYLKLKVIDQKTVYYAGFSWKERGDFSNHQEWQQHLNEFSEKLNNPLEVSVIN